MSLSRHRALVGQVSQVAPFGGCIRYLIPTVPHAPELRQFIAERLDGESIRIAEPDGSEVGFRSPCLLGEFCDGSFQRGRRVVWDVFVVGC